MLIDSHAHLALFDKAERGQIVENAMQAGVSKILTIGTNLADSRESCEIAGSFSQVSAAVGVHPHDVEDTSAKDFLDELRMMADQETVVAIGEIGLDFYRMISPPDLQKDFFRRQLELAQELHLPVIIHDRAADQECLEILRDFDFSETGGIFHCFSGDLAMAEDVWKMGFLVSIAGPVTFKKPGFLPDVAKGLPLEALLVESDCPYLAPVPFRGKRNEPAYVKYTAEKVAELRGISVEELAGQTSRNFAALFKRMG
ncbi:hydrolase TatD [candidate division KSB3 bacterium]|uniref:Hydrolase TatD n=1 Tax=candidate division KSB3 bacterium TaxID=2044937 RepID=A0A2G6E530_9BACT|nr:MAG: hydrolase TatD [candidate division KSB3 bacterium]PIE29469.1 MAG: hydrolase TatD [candidate division KSB3 bacterium]